MTRYTCCDELRRNSVAAHPTLNGIDYLEVLDRDAPAGSPRQRTLLVRCLKPLPALGVENVQLSGGERLRNVEIEWVAAASAPPAAETTAAEQAFFTALPQADHVLLVRTSAYGDYSPYGFRLQRSATDARAPRGFDPQLVEVSFSFKVECPTDFDCKPVCNCPSWRHRRRVSLPKRTSPASSKRFANETVCVLLCFGRPLLCVLSATRPACPRRARPARHGRAIRHPRRR